MAHELAHRPASIFGDRGATEIAKTRLFLRLMCKSFIKPQSVHISKLNSVFLIGSIDAFAVKKQ